MNLFRLSLMDLPRERLERLAWADIAKAISIILLVAWSVIGSRYYVSETLILLRMPLFFFVSGLFAHRAVTQTDARSFLRDKFTNFLYLYALWEVLLFFSREGVEQVVFGRPADPGPLLTLFWVPIFNIWFLYALALAFLAAWLLRRVPVGIVLVGAVALYVASVADGNWRYMAFLDRFVRLFPFFWLGLVLRPLLDPLVERHYRLWPPVAAAFLVSAWFLFDSPWNSIGGLTMAVTLVGIAGMLLLSRHLAEWNFAAGALATLGASTLYVYVLHKIALFYLDHGLMAFELRFPGDRFALVAVIVPVCAIAGRWAARQAALGWLFTAPWVHRAPRPVATPAE